MYKPGVRNLDRSEKPALTHEWIEQLGMAGGDEMLFALQESFEYRLTQAPRHERRHLMEQLEAVKKALADKTRPTDVKMTDFIKEATVVAKEEQPVFGGQDHADKCIKR